VNLNLDFVLSPDENQSSLTLLDNFTLVSECGKRYPIINGIPRFVPQDNYALGFGKQWNLFRKTQLDSFTGLKLSEDRLKRCLGEGLENLNGKFVLEAGSGAGRFTEILIKYGATVHSFDYSNAVEANAKNNGDSKNLTLVQADIRHIPFRQSSYDYVICLGVLQHTPDPEESIRSLWKMLKPGGRLVFDHYRKKFRNYLPPPFGVAGMLYRHFILRLPLEKQYQTVKQIFDFWFPIIWHFRDSKAIQFILSRLTPVVMYYPSFGLRDKEMYYEWMLLDTHDAMTDRYKHRRTKVEIEKFLLFLGATEVTTTNGGNGVEARCKKPV
jgi:SAM-dependent methyltransferase